MNARNISVYVKMVDNVLIPLVAILANVLLDGQDKTVPKVCIIGLLNFFFFKERLCNNIDGVIILKKSSGLMDKVSDSGLCVRTLHWLQP